MIVKISFPLNNPTAPCLLYDQKKTIQTMIETRDLPEKIQKVIGIENPKVYWHMVVRHDGTLDFKNKAGDQWW